MRETKKRTRELDQAKEPKRVIDAEITQFYNSALYVLNNGISAGKANAGEGLFAIHQLADLLHGGAYAAPITQRPFWLADPKQSIYYAKSDGPQLKDIKAFFTQNLGQIFSFGGPTAQDWATEIMMNANVPHVLPKLLSDEAYARATIFFGQEASVSLFGNGATGLKTLVDAGTEGAERLLGARGDDEKPVRLSNSQMEKLQKGIIAVLSNVEETLG